jgi:Flp pilus assembly protein TadG
MRALGRDLEPLSRLRHRLRAFREASQGVAAVEFAIVLPVMLMMYLGMTELTFGINTDRKITLLARTLADLTGRATTVSSSDMDTIFAASTSVMAPYNSALAQMVVSSIVVTDTGTKDAGGNPIVQGTVCWSSAKGSGAVALTKGTKVTVPDGFRTANSSYIQADVAMPYTPVFGTSVLQMVTGKTSMTLTDQTPWPVRNVKEVIWTGTAACLP